MDRVILRFFIFVSH